MEDAPQFHFGCTLRPSTLKQRDEVVASAVAQSFGCSDGSAEVFVVAIVGQGDEKVRQADFEGHAHAAFQVEAEVQLLLFHLTVSVADGEQGDGVDLCRSAVAKELACRLGSGLLEGLVSEGAFALQGVGHVGTKLVRLLLVLARHSVEREGVQRGKGQQHCENDEDVFVLHDRLGSISGARI